MSDNNLLPNTTQIPNVILDHWLPHLTGSELRVVLYVCRRTYGFGKQEDRISLKQMVEGIRKRDGTVLDQGAGLSKSAAAEACKSLEQKRVLVRRQTQRAGGADAATAYALNLQRRPNGGVQKLDTGCPETGQGGVQKSDTQNPVLQNQDVEANASSGKPQTSGVVPTEKYVTDRIYEAMKEAGTRLPAADYPYHLGRAKDMLAKDSPTDEERETLPAAFVRLWQIKGRADAPAALMEMRRQRAREEILANNTRPDFSGAKRINPQSDAAVAAKDKPRSVVWYSAFYRAPPPSIEAWIDEGLGHAEIMRRCEKGVA